MGYSFIIWDLDADLDGNVQHLADHDVTTDEAEEVLANPEHQMTSRSSGLPVVFGTTSTGRFIAVVFQEIDDDTARPVTAYDIEE
jgi:uncharacterized DUF497 family protein